MGIKSQKKKNMGNACSADDVHNKELNDNISWDASDSDREDVDCVAKSARKSRFEGMTPEQKKEALKHEKLEKKKAEKMAAKLDARKSEKDARKSEKMEEKRAA